MKVPDRVLLAHGGGGHLTRRLVVPHRVDFIAPDFISAYRGLGALARLAYGAGRVAMTMEYLAGQMDPAGLYYKVFDLLGARTLEYEAGEWAPPAEPAPVKRKYHGY